VTAHRRAYFKTGALNHSATLPSEFSDLAGVRAPGKDQSLPRRTGPGRL
jgi:hypothetical protein